MSQICIIIVMVLYLALMLYVGFASNKKGSGKSVDEFYLGNRKIGPLVTAMSAEASDMSSYLLMGLPGLAYLTGICDVGWTIIGLAAGTYLNWLLVSQRLRRYSEKIGAITIPDFFSKRYHDERNILSCIAALVILIFFIPYTASGFKAIGTLFNSLFGIDYHVAMIVGGAVVVAYTVIGGFLAVSTTDLMQSIVMTFALIAIVLFGIEYAGGWDNVVANAQSMSGYLAMNATYDLATGNAVPYGFLTVCSTLAWGLGYFGMPHILLRFMGIRDEKELTLCRRIAGVWVVISMGVAILIGVVGYSLMSSGIVPAYANNSEAETLIIDIAKVISTHGVLPAVVGGVILAGILASTMSTSDSQLLAAASSVSQNLVREVFKMNISEKTAIILARISVLVISVIAVFLAMDPNSSVFRIVSFAWAGFGAVFGPAVLFALFWKRANKWGILTGMIAGGSMIFIWKFIIRTAFAGSVLDIYELLPAFIVNCIFVVAVSLMTKAPDQAVIDTFDEVAKEIR